MWSMRTIALLVLASMTSCAPTLVLLQNHRGEIVRCEPPNGPYDGVIRQNQAMEACIRQYESAGYIRLDGEKAEMGPAVAAGSLKACYAALRLYQLTESILEHT